MRGERKVGGEGGEKLQELLMKLHSGLGNPNECNYHVPLSCSRFWPPYSIAPESIAAQHAHRWHVGETEPVTLT